MRANRRRQVLVALQAGRKTRAELVAAVGCPPTSVDAVLADLLAVRVVGREPSSSREFDGMQRPFVYEVRA